MFLLGFGSSHCYYDQTEGGFTGGVFVPVIMIGPSSRSKGGLAAGGRDWEGGDAEGKTCPAVTFALVGCCVVLLYVVQRSFFTTRTSAL